MTEGRRKGVIGMCGRVQGETEGLGVSFNEKMRRDTSMNSDTFEVTRRMPVSYTTLKKSFC